MILCQKCLFEATCKCKCKEISFCIKHYNEHIRSEAGSHLKEEFFDEVNIESKFLMINKLDSLKEQIQDLLLAQIKLYVIYETNAETINALQALMKIIIEAIQLIDKIYLYILKSEKIYKQSCPSVADFFLTQPSEITSKYIKVLTLDLGKSQLYEEIITIKRKLVNFNYFCFCKHIFGISTDYQKAKDLFEAFYFMGSEFLFNKEYEKAEMAFSRCKNIYELEKIDDKVDTIRIEIYSAIFPFLQTKDYRVLMKAINKIKMKLNRREKAGLYYELALLFISIYQPKEAIKFYKAAIKKTEKPHPVKFFLLLKLGSLLRDANKPKEAMKFYKMGLKFGKEIEHKDLIKVYNCIALLYLYILNFKKAEKYWLIAKNKLEESNNCLEDYAMVLHNYADLHIQLDQISESLDLLKQAKQIYKNKIIDSQRLADVYNSLGVVYRRARNTKKSFKAFRKARTICETYLPKNHPLIAGLYQNIANAELDIGDNRRGIALFKQSAEIYEMFNDMVKLGSAYLSLAAAYFDIQEYPEAEEYLTKAYPILEKFAQNETLFRFYIFRSKLYIRIKNYDQAQENMTNASKFLTSNKKDEADLHFEAALLHSELGNYNEALNSFMKCKELRENILKDEDDLCTLYRNISVLYRNIGNMDLAKAFVIKSLNIAKKIYSPYQVDLAKVFMEFGILCLILTEYNIAENYLMESMKIYQLKDPYYLPDLGLLFMNIGNLKNSTRNMDEAKVYYRKSIDTFRRCGMSNTANVGDVNLNLGVLHYNMKDFNSAEAYYLNAMNIYEQLLDPYNKQLLRLYWNIGIVYWNTKVKDKALNYFLKCKNIIEKTEPNELSIKISNGLQAKINQLEFW